MAGFEVITEVFREETPLRFFSLWAALFTMSALALGYPLVDCFLKYHTVPKFPTAIAALLAYLAIPRWTAARKTRQAAAG